MNKQSLIYIGRTENERYAYNFATQEFFMNKNYKKERSFLVGFAGLGSLFGNFLYNIFSFSSVHLSPLTVLVYSTFLMIIVIFLILNLGLFVAERFMNYKRYEKITNEDFLTKDNLLLLKSLIPGNGMFIGYAFFLVLSICMIPILIHFYLQRGDLPLWGLYMLSLVLNVYSIHSIWYYKRMIKNRKTIIQKLESRINHGK